MRKLRCLIIILSIFMIVNACNKGKKVDLIIHNTHIYTVDSVFSTAECMVIDKGKIIDIGGDDIMGKYQAKELKDMHGKYIYPGFIDAHCHYYGYLSSYSKLI